VSQHSYSPGAPGCFDLRPDLAFLPVRRQSAAPVNRCTSAARRGQDRRVDEPVLPSEPLAKLLARWDIPVGAAVALTERGTNNRTLQVTAGDRRWFQVSSASAALTSS
jgi:hypothetical protein